MLMALMGWGLGAAEPADTTKHVTNTRTAHIHYRLAKTNIDPTFADNAAVMDSLSEFINGKDNKIIDVDVESYASPEGSVPLNRRLSDNRARSAANFLVGEGLSESIMSINSHGEEYKEAEGMLKSAWPKWRRSDIYINYYRAMQDDMMPAVRPLGGMAIYDGVPKVVLSPIQPIPEEPLYETVPFIAVGSNALYDLVTVANVTVEVPVKDHWSFGLDYKYPWFAAKDDMDCLELIQLELFGRYWFGKDRKRVLTGWYGELAASGGYYDLERKGKGYQGEFSTISLGAGYVWGLSKHWSFGVSASVGWMGTKYRKYDGYNGEGKHLILKYNAHYTWIGPTEIGATFTYLFYRNRRVR